MDDVLRAAGSPRKSGSWKRQVRVRAGVASVAVAAAVVFLWLASVSAAAEDGLAVVTAQQGVSAEKAPQNRGSKSFDVVETGDSAVPPGPTDPGGSPSGSPVPSDSEPPAAAAPPESSDPPGPDAGDPADASDPADLQPAETDEVEVGESRDDAKTDAAESAQDSEAAGDPPTEVSAPAVTDAPSTPPIAPAVLPLASARAGVAPAQAAQLAARQRSRRRSRVVAPPWETRGPLVSALPGSAWQAPARPSIYTPIQLAPPLAQPGSSPRRAQDKQVTPEPPKAPPPAPRSPGSSTCVGSSPCGGGFLAVLAPLAALGCLCALLFERLFEAMSLWRPERFLSLRERPG